MLTAVAAYIGETLSAFMRRAAIDTAQAVMDAEGVEAILKHYDELQRRREDFTGREREFLIPHFRTGDD